MGGSEAVLVVAPTRRSFISNIVSMFDCKWLHMIERLSVSSQIEEGLTDVGHSEA